MPLQVNNAGIGDGLGKTVPEQAGRRLEAGADFSPKHAARGFDCGQRREGVAVHRIKNRTESTPLSGSGRGNGSEWHHSPFGS